MEKILKMLEDLESISLNLDNAVCLFDLNGSTANAEVFDTYAFWYRELENYIEAMKREAKDWLDNNAC